MKSYSITMQQHVGWWNPMISPWYSLDISMILWMVAKSCTKRMLDTLEMMGWPPFSTGDSDFASINCIPWYPNYIPNIHPFTYAIVKDGSVYIPITGLMTTPQYGTYSYVVTIAHPEIVHQYVRMYIYIYIHPSTYTCTYTIYVCIYDPKILYSLNIRYEI